MRTKMAFENAGYWIKDYKMYRKQENGENFVVLRTTKDLECGLPGDPTGNPGSFMCG